MTCHIPITVRVYGTLGEQHVDQLAETVRRTVARRLAQARRELRHTDRQVVVRAATSAAAGPAMAEAVPPPPATRGEPGEPFDAARAVFGDYRLPSYNAAGGPVSVPLLQTLPIPENPLLAVLRESVGRFGVPVALAELDRLIAADERETVDVSGVTADAERARANLTARRAARAELDREMNSIAGRFPGDVTALALHYLDVNKTYLYEQRQRYGSGLPAAARTPEQAARLAELRRLAVAPAVAVDLRRRLRRYPIGTVPAGVFGDGLEVSFDPRGKPPIMTPYPATPSWGQLKTYDDQLAELIAESVKQSPEIYMLVQLGSVETMASIQVDRQAHVLDYAFGDVDRKIEAAREQLATGELDWRDLKPLHAALFRGTRGASGTDWSEPYHRHVALELMRGHEEREFWKQLGIDVLAMAAFLFAEIATGGAATLFLLAGVGVSGYQVVSLWEKAAALETAHGASTRGDLELVTREQALSAHQAALFATVFAVGAVLDAGIGRAAKQLAGRQLPKVAQRVTLSPDVLPQYASKSAFMEATRARLLAQRAAGKPSLMDFLLGPDGKWRTGSFIAKSGRPMRGRYALSNPDEMIVQAGHLQSDAYAKAAGRREYLALEDADLNWFTGQTIEAQDVYSSKPAVMIDGYPVDIPTARLYEGAGALPAGTVDAAPLITPPGL